MSDYILVVDDDHAVRKLTTFTLNRSGYQVYGAQSGQGGYETFMQHVDEIGMVVTDVVMPTMNGPEMIDHILAAKPDVKVLFMTGYNAAAVLPEHYAKRFGVLGKPFTAGALVQAVRECFTKCR